MININLSPRLLLTCILTIASLTGNIHATKDKTNPSHIKTEAKGTDKKQVIHPALGTSVTSTDGALRITLDGRKQNYGGRPANTRDVSILSPKSVNIHPSGSKYYVNSLEGGITVVYDARTAHKIKVISHKIGAEHANLWAPSSNLYTFRHQYKQPRHFMGKPVESTFSHNGRYLWVPYYRRSFDINAQDPSAVAIIDTKTDCIVRLMDTGPLPKMIATSPDGKYVAISHWGDNTVGLIDISSANPKDWKHITYFTVDKKLELNYSLTTPVNRDSNSGNALRGTVFTPDGRYLLVGCMGGNGGIAVIDIQQRKYLGKLYGMMSNMRHLVISHGYLYLSINNAGYVQRLPLKEVLAGISKLNGKSTTLTGWQNCKVGGGARTLELSPDGRYAYVACNTASKLCVVDTRTMKQIAEIDVDSFPVGLDVSPTGALIFVTGQGRKGHPGSGNALDIFRVTRLK